MKALRFSLILIALTVSLQVAAQEASRPAFAFVDIERAILSVEDGQQAVAELNQQLEEKQAQLDAAEQSLRDFSAQLEQDLVMLDAETRNRRLAEYQQRVQEYQELYLTNQQALLVLEAEATKEIVERMVELVGEIAAEGGLNIVFEKTRSALVWASTDIDLTDQLIQRYEERF